MIVEIMRICRSNKKVMSRSYESEKNNKDSQSNEIKVMR